MTRKIAKGEQLKNDEELKLDEKNNDHNRTERFKNHFNLAMIIIMWGVIILIIILVFIVIKHNPNEMPETILKVLVGAVGGFLLENFRKRIDK
ncbi:MAG TPA: hypothetical protein DDY52_03330 [Candidatus Moranbacteria bacterium]|nr:hypothetical protein [Candidatus Moranbacteria bacterium]